MEKHEETFQDKFTELVHDLDLSRNAVAEHLEVSPTTVDRWMNGVTAPQPRTAKAILEVLSRLKV